VTAMCVWWVARPSLLLLLVPLVLLLVLLRPLLLAAVTTSGYCWKVATMGILEMQRRATSRRSTGFVEPRWRPRARWRFPTDANPPQQCYPAHTYT